MTNRTYKFAECRYNGNVVRTTLNERLESKDFEITLLFDKNSLGEYTRVYVCDKETAYSEASFNIVKFEYNAETKEAVVTTAKGIQAVFTLYREWETEDGIIDLSEIYCL